jgi:hypothetical protein
MPLSGLDLSMLIGVSCCYEADSSWWDFWRRVREVSAFVCFFFYSFEKSFF